MYTRCPACHTVYPLSAPLLVQDHGRYRCGKCNTISDALDSLFDEWPDAAQPAPESGQTPTLGINLDLPVQNTDDNPDDVEFAGPADKQAPKDLSRHAWLITAFALLVVAVINFVYFFGQPVLKNQHIQESLVSIGVLDSQARREPGQIKLVSSNLRSHPSAINGLRLSATLRNDSDSQKDYPDLEVVLLGSDGQAVASRLFKASEYLAGDANIEQGMSPQANLPVVLDLADPGRKAVGFELRVR